MLRLLSQDGLALARDLHDRALSARDTRTACELADAYAKVADQVRRAIADEAALRREPAPGRPQRRIPGSQAVAELDEAAPQPGPPVRRVH